MSNEKDWQIVKALTRSWLIKNGVALTGVNGEVSRSTVNRFKLALQRQIVDCLITIRQEERRAAFRDAVAAVPQVGVTFPEGYEEWIDAPSYRENVIAALEAAANETREDGDDG